MSTTNPNLYTSSPAAGTAGYSSQGNLDASCEQLPEFGRDVLTYLHDYARERPDVAAMWCLGIGFVLGWKLKPW